MADRRPSITDIKLLFARSGNQCAFSNCDMPIADGDTLIGEVCHIRGEKPTSARYDANQTSIQRHAYSNLILMCPTYHTIIDDNPSSYPAKDLLKLKAEHERLATPISEFEASRVAQQFIDQSKPTIIQTGSFSAHTIHRQNITLNPARADSIGEARRIQAVEALWAVLRSLRDEFANLATVNSVLLPCEIDACLRNGASNRFIDLVRPYADEKFFWDKYVRTGVEGADTERPFVSRRLWAIFHALQAVHGRVAILFMHSFRDRRYQNWRDDTVIDQHLKATLPPRVVDSLKKQTAYGLKKVVDCLEDQYITEAGMGPVDHRTQL